jgi:hypothetical protein
MKQENRMLAIKGPDLTSSLPTGLQKGAKRMFGKDVSKCIMMHWTAEAFGDAFP